MQRDDKHIVNIQARIRSTLAKQRYQINHLSKNELKDYLTFVIGNDPKMPAELKKFHEPNEKIALIGASGLRVISLACKLGNSKNLPKIFLIDNSNQVQKFWQAMRDFIGNDQKAGNEKLFLNNLPHFLASNKHLYRNIKHDGYKKNCTKTVKYLSQDINSYFKTLFKLYGYDYVRRIILHTSLIKQSWTNEDVFVKIKNILHHLDIKKIYMYPSNIFDAIDDEDLQNKFLENIQSLNPQLCIHTYELGNMGMIPNKVLLATNQDPTFIRKSLSICSADTFSLLLKILLEGSKDKNEKLTAQTLSPNKNSNEVSFQLESRGQIKNSTQFFAHPVANPLVPPFNKEELDKRYKMSFGQNL